MRPEAKTMRKVTLLLAAMALAVVLAALPAQAATTFTVNSTTDAPDTDTADGVCDSNSGEDGKQCTLRAAIQEANAQANAQEAADVIEVPAGSYTLTIKGGSEEASATGDLDITDDVTINGAGANSTTVAGSGAEFGDRIVENHSGASTTIFGLTITEGSADIGGGIYNNGGTLTVSDSAITGNTTSLDGGGIYNDYGTLKVVRSTISGNEATEWGGGIASYTSATSSLQRRPPSLTEHHLR